MRTLAALVTLLVAATVNAGTFAKGGPATTDNDSSCDISVMPAATLLLPYFEVDLDREQTTIFTVTNNGETERIAHVTLWTDWGYAAVTFDLALAGYGAQSIDLYDVIGRGRLASSCAQLPVDLPAAAVARMQSAFTLGKTPDCNPVGNPHENAIGYATIDVVGACTSLTANDAVYFTEVIRYDNVLSGDYLQVSGDHDAQASPLVHIRAIPEGGRATHNMPRTFYSRFLPASQPLLDARQPLPSLFSARWISGGAAGYETHFNIWREGLSKPGTVCSRLAAGNAVIPFVEVVRFDEEENLEVYAPDNILGIPPSMPTLPSTARVSVEDYPVVPLLNYAEAGWIYFNLDSSEADAVPLQAWVTVSMRAQDRFITDFDAVVLGNGCSAPLPRSWVTGDGDPIAPAPNKRP